MIAAIRRVVRFRRHDDSALAARLSTELDLPEDITVTVERGVVFLTGTVANEDEIEGLLDQVRRVPGVRSVSHDLTPIAGPRA
jgi:osmotically-inducible protein OsmY